MIVHLELATPAGPVTITYLSRAVWKAGPLRAGRPLPAGHVWQGWALHHTVMVLPDYDRDGYRHGDLDDVTRYMRQLQAARPDLGGEVPYPFVVFNGSNDRHAVVCEGRGVTVTGAHTAGLNSKILAWAFAGDLRTETISTGALWAMRWLGHRHTPHATRATIGHRQAPPYYSNGTNLNATDCPSANGMSRIHELQPPFRELPPVTASTPPSEEKILMDVAEILSDLKNELRPRGRLGGWYHDRATGTEWILQAGPTGPVNVFPQQPGVLAALADRGDLDPSPLRVDGPVAAEMWRLWGAPAT